MNLNRFSVSITEILHMCQQADDQVAKLAVTSATIGESLGNPSAVYIRPAFVSNCKPSPSANSAPLFSLRCTLRSILPWPSSFIYSSWHADRFLKSAPLPRLSTVRRTRSLGAAVLRLTKPGSSAVKRKEGSW